MDKKTLIQKIIASILLLVVVFSNIREYVPSWLYGIFLVVIIFGSQVNIKKDRD